MTTTSRFFFLLQIKKGMVDTTNVGDEGGFAPNLQNTEEAIKLIIKAIEKSGFKPGEEISICLDVAANELDKEKTIEYYSELIKKYPIKSIEDPFGEDDWESWKKLTKNTNIQIVGDDLFATNIKRLEKGIKDRSANAILVKLNQIGTVSETLDVINLAHKNGFKTIISHRSGDSEDTFIADLAVATNSSQIKTGSLARSERVAKYNRLIRNGTNLKSAAYIAGISRFRAITLTSITTVAGLMPLMIQNDFQSRFLIPMAVSVAFGVLFGTFFILYFFTIDLPTCKPCSPIS